jgi:hypothetical protein
MLKRFALVVVGAVALAAFGGCGDDDDARSSSSKIIVLPATEDDYAFTAVGDFALCRYHNSIGPAFVRCDISDVNEENLPARPADCELEWGVAWGIGIEGDGGPSCVGDSVSVDPGTAPELAAGTTLRAAPFTCSARRRALRCTRADGHGFEVHRNYQEGF